MTTEETKDSLVGFLMAIFATKIDQQNLEWFGNIVEAMTERWDIVEKKRRENMSIDDKVHEWHNLPDSNIPLHEFLGMTWEQYVAWGRDPDSIEPLTDDR